MDAAIGVEESNVDCLAMAIRYMIVRTVGVEQTRVDGEGLGVGRSDVVAFVVLPFAVTARGWAEECPGRSGGSLVGPSTRKANIVVDDVAVGEYVVPATVCKQIESRGRRRSAEKHRLL